MDCSPSGSSTMGFCRQEYWSGLPCPPPGDLPNPGIEQPSLRSPALASGFFITSATWEALSNQIKDSLLEWGLNPYAWGLICLPSKFVDLHSNLDSSSKELACNARALRSIPGSGRSPWRRGWLPTPVLLPEESHGQRSLVGYCLQGCKESDMTEQPTLQCESIWRSGL